MLTNKNVENNTQQPDVTISTAIEADQLNVEKDELLFTKWKNNFLQIAETLPHHCLQFCCLS